ncbi:hypothetical protein [Pararhodobacter sp. CCB-MM2]|uniref:hypothetical protein n=1 Tax=Pararhodobacter sp. CCB-MM2 TaxID=1786003 RepID=UPI00082BB387|nr:hypothetical protein [Pararhodobacter sp. CCB-MM2]
MLDDDLPDFALRGEKGIDLFHRIEDRTHKRARYRCLATVEPGEHLVIHAPEMKRDPEALLRTATALATDPIAAPLSLTDPESWPRAVRGADPIRLFLYLDFLRAWQVADMGSARLEAQAASSPGALPVDLGRIAGAIAPVFDFNRLSRGIALTRLLVPVLAGRVRDPRFRDDSHGGTGYALRMLGDLCLRGDQPGLALDCFETAVAAGDNPFRRRKAIEAARAARDTQALAKHREAFAAQWPLPADLAAENDTKGNAA